MRRIQPVVAVAAMMVAMLSFSVPAMADVDLDDLYEERAELIDEYYDDLDDIDDIDDLDDLDDVEIVWTLD
jgi:hypothetical protein